MSRKIQNSQDVLKATGKRIRDRRIKKGWSLPAMAKVAGMNANDLGNIERGELDIRLATLKKIAKAFKVSISRLFQGIA